MAPGDRPRLRQPVGPRKTILNQPHSVAFGTCARPGCAATVVPSPAVHRARSPEKRGEERNRAMIDISAQLDEPTPARVKGIVDIRAGSLLENSDLFGRALTVLIGQWGLDAVEVRIAADKPEPV